MSGSADAPTPAPGGNEDSMSISNAIQAMVGLVFLLALSVVLVMPSIKVFAGPVGAEHSFLTFYWTVSPGWGLMLIRAGACATGVLFVGLWRPNWFFFRWLWTGAYTSREEITERVATFAVAVVLLLGIFAGMDRQGAHDHPKGGAQCFSTGVLDKSGNPQGELDMANAMYFTLGNLTTAGTGTVVPTSPSCRAMTATQTAIGALVILVGVGGLVDVVLDYRRRKAGQAAANES
jgi:hypothetical protein